MAHGADVFKRFGHRFLPESPVMIRSDCLRGTLIKDAPYGAGTDSLRQQLVITCYDIDTAGSFLPAINDGNLFFTHLIYILNRISMFLIYFSHLGHLVVKVLTYYLLFCFTPESFGS